MSGPKLTGCRCQCDGCGDYFGSVVVFDRHRVGSYGKPGGLKYNRRCLTPSEMEARGWVRNGRGFWIRQAVEDGPAGIQAPRVTLPATPIAGA